MCDTTIVSCYYKLNNSKHSLNNYIQWMKNFFLIKTPKIIFTNLETYNYYFKNNIEVNNRDDVYFYLLEWNHFKTWDYIEYFKKHLELDPEKKYIIFIYIYYGMKKLHSLIKVLN